MESLSKAVKKLDKALDKSLPGVYNSLSNTDSFRCYSKLSIKLADTGAFEHACKLFAQNVASCEFLQIVCLLQITDFDRPIRFNIRDESNNKLPVFQAHLVCKKGASLPV